MPLAALLTHIGRDDRRRARAAAGSLLARSLPTPADPIVTWGGATTLRYAAAVKPAGLSVPEGVVVLAVRRDALGRCYALLVEPFEGDAAAFSSFPRLALMLGATELQLHTRAGTMLERARVARDLAWHARADRAALLARPLAVAGAYDRAAIMATACAVAKARQSATGEAWGICLSAALKGAWILARAARAATAH